MKRKIEVDGLDSLGDVVREYRIKGYISILAGFLMGLSIALMMLGVLLK